MPNKLSEIRNKRGLTQDELGKRVGVSRVHIGKIERGDVNGSIKLLARIAKELDCKLDDIFFIHGDKY